MVVNVFKYRCRTDMIEVKDGCHNLIVAVEGCVMATGELEAQAIACESVIALFKKKRKIIDFEIICQEVPS